MTEEALAPEAESETTPEVDAQATTETVDAENSAPETDEQSTTTEKSDADSENAEEPETVEQLKAKLESANRKLAKTSYEKREAKRQAERAMALAESTKNQPAQAKAPNIEDFETLDEYLNARDAHQRQAAQPTHDPNVDAAVAVFTQKRDDLMFEGAGKYADFEDKVGSPEVTITPSMADAIFEYEDMDTQVELAYYLADNPREAAKIARIESPLRQAAAIGKLEARLTAPKPAKVKPSSAPKPVKPVGGNKTKSDGVRPGMSPEDFIKARNKQLGRG